MSEKKLEQVAANIVASDTAAIIALGITIANGGGEDVKALHNYFAAKMSAANEKVPMEFSGDTVTHLDRIITNAFAIAPAIVEARKLRG